MNDTTERSDDAPLDQLEQLTLSPAAMPGSIRTVWYCPLRLEGPDVLFIVEADHSLDVAEMAERVKWARSREDLRRLGA